MQELVDGIKSRRRSVQKDIVHVLHKAIPAVVEARGAATKY